MSKNKTIEQTWASDLPALVEAGLLEDKKNLELSAMSLVRRLRNDFPDVAKGIAAVLSGYSKGSGAFRSVGVSPPADRDTHANLLQVEDATRGALKPVFDARIESEVARFVAERELAEELLHAGVMPANKLLLTGAPGTGKTMLATWLAQKLEMKIAVFDLATSLSSLLGNTGLNIKRIFSYAKQESIILFLDEFDAIAKRRDDATDVGELKRIVNVLLKEMESWPSRSILIAATNHPELLDPAIYRRFDSCVFLPLPDKEQIIAIIARSLGERLDTASPSILDLLGEVLKGKNASEIVLYSNNAIKHHLINGMPLDESLMTTLLDHARRENSKKIGFLCYAMKQALGAKISVRKLAELSGLSTTTVQYHIKKGVR